MGKEESGGLGFLPKILVDGSCVTALVKQIESRTSPQDSGKSALRDPSTQTIRKRTTGKGHKKHNGKEQV